MHQLTGLRLLGRHLIAAACMLWCLSGAGLAGCGKSGEKPAGGTATQPPARPAATERPAAQNAPEKAAAPLTLEKVAAAASDAAAQKPPADSPHDLLMKQYEWASGRLEGLNMARTFLNDQDLNTLVEQFSEKVDALIAKIGDLEKASGPGSESIVKDAGALVAEIKALDIKINERVKAIKP